MSRINLDGGEIGILRALGFSGTPMPGCDLKGRVGRMSDNDLAECLKTMVTLGYITATPDLDHVEDLDSTAFAVNTGYVKALREAMDPPKEPVKRVRRQ
ncbi:MAG: hypothetical protein WCH57_07795 [Verrucomicrobiota bacterium]